MVFDTERMLAEAKNGNKEILGQLLDQYRPYLFVLAHRYLDQRVQGRVDANDLVQQTFMEAHRDFQDFRGENVATLLAWLRNMLRNNIATIHQRHLFAQRRTAAREVDVGGATGDNSSMASPGLEGMIPSETTSPSQRLMKDEAAAKLAISLERLPDTQSEAIRLRYLEGFSLKDIALRMGKTEMAVAGLLKRGLYSLRIDLLTDQ